jgi:predicted nucleotidyltransferase
MNQGDPRRGVGGELTPATAHGTISTMDAVLQEFVRRVHEALGDEVERMSLFGSRARGRHRPYSDYDLMVVVRGSRAQARKVVADVAIDLMLQSGASVSTKVVTAEDFRKAHELPTSFWRNLRRDEVLLWPM